MIPKLVYSVPKGKNGGLEVGVLLCFASSERLSERMAVRSKVVSVAVYTVVRGHRRPPYALSDQ